MMYLITGGSGSGKSVFSEKLLLSFGDEQRLYLATMIPFDQEGKERVIRHQEMRKEKGFITIECPLSISALRFAQKGNILLECMSNLLANELYQDQGSKEDCIEEIVKGIIHLNKQSNNLVVVTNEVFCAGLYDQETNRYLAYLGEINRRLAEMADYVSEIVYGIEIPLKGN